VPGERRRVGLGVEDDPHQPRQDMPVIGDAEQGDQQMTRIELWIDEPGILLGFLPVRLPHHR
jgi:hypothetical protein